MITLKILTENRENEEFKGEPGLSIYVNAFGNKFLLDTGFTDLFLQNAKLMNLSLDDVEKIVITHGHNDHSGGITFLENKKTIIMHPNAYKERWSIRRADYAGFLIPREKLLKKHTVIETKEPLLIHNNCYYLGEIPMTVDIEKDGNYATTLDHKITEIDVTEDDSGVAITTDKGLFIMTGCGHRGICNTIEYAKKVTGQNTVYGVLGGFHLREVEPQKEKIDYTINYFKQNNIKELYLGHCIKDEVIEYFENNLKDVTIHRLAAGKEFNIDVEPLNN